MSTINNDEVDLPIKAVIYTDGGCKPSRGIGGWGIHGYTYTDEKPKQGSGCKQGIPTAKGYRKGAKDEAVSLLQYVDAWGSLIPQSTNNIAELTAAYKAIQVASDLDTKEIYFRVDSKYVIEGVTKWAVGWEKNNWIKSDGTEVANREQWEILLAALREIEDKDVKISWNWVKGHSGAIGNEMADRNATRGITIGRKGISDERVRFSEAKGYWSPKTEVNRMFSQSKWYFNTNVGGALKSDDGRWVYHLGDHGKDDELLGKRISDACFSVLYTKEPEPVLETVRAYQDHISPSAFNSVIIGRLDTLLSKDVYPEMTVEKEKFLIKAPRHVDLYTLDDRPATKECRPPRLAFRAIESLTVLESLLSDFLTDPKSRGITVTEITDLIYDVDPKAKTPCKIKPDLNNTVKSLDAKANYCLAGKEGNIDLILTLGLDIAKRNTLSALANRSPKVSLLTWRESDSAFRYATVIEAGDDVGIWAGIYSNIRMLS